MSFKVIQEPAHIDIFNKYSEGSRLTDVVPAGTAVMKTGADTVAKSDGTSFYGICSQNVFPTPLQGTFQPYLNNEAYDGDNIGIYTQPTVFSIDPVSGVDYKADDEVYVSSEGLYVTEKVGSGESPTATKGEINVGRVISADASGVLIHFYGLHGA